MKLHNTVVIGYYKNTLGSREKCSYNQYVLITDYFCSLEIRIRNILKLNINTIENTYPAIGETMFLTGFSNSLKNLIGAFY